MCRDEMYIMWRAVGCVLGVVVVWWVVGAISRCGACMHGGGAAGTAYKKGCRSRAARSSHHRQLLTTTARSKARGVQKEPM
eukprot:COSAG01_NODE_54307_length_333_cov_0.538462_1_plen_80_part_10